MKDLPRITPAPHPGLKDRPDRTTVQLPARGRLSICRCCRAYENRIIKPMAALELSSWGRCISDLRYVRIARIKAGQANKYPRQP